MRTLRAKKRSRSALQPIPTELGQQIGAEMCKDCWKEWQEKQKQLINHFGLDVSNPDSHSSSSNNMKIFFYNEGVELTQIDTSKECSVKLVSYFAFSNFSAAEFIQYRSPVGFGPSSKNMAEMRMNRAHKNLSAAHPQCRVPSFR